MTNDFLKATNDMLRDVKRMLLPDGRMPYGRWEILLAYFRLKLAERIGARRRVERILGFTVHFFSYGTLNFLLSEIFVGREYQVALEKKSPFIIDCGCNIGMSILFYKKLYPGAVILGFEPDPAAFEMLSRNVEANGMTDVTILRKAVSDAEGKIGFYRDRDNPGTLDMSTRPDRGPTERVEVDAVRLSQYVRSEVDILKLDIEGAESRVLEEMHREKKLGFVRHLVIEYHHHITPDDDGMSKILAMLEESGFGYQIHGHVRPPAEAGRYQNVMIYAYRKACAGSSSGDRP